jgi:hypothetical protein
MTRQCLSQHKKASVLFITISLLFCAGLAQLAQAQIVSQSVASKYMDYKEYVLTFTEFSAPQISQWQTFIRHYSGYNSVVIDTQNTQTIRVRYSTTADKDMLINNVKKTAEYLGLDILIRTQGTRIDVRFIQSLPKSLPYKEW